MKSYFELRNINPDHYSTYEIPSWLSLELKDIDRNSKILDFGCGFGQAITALKKEGFKNSLGADVDRDAIAFCRSLGHDVYNLYDEIDFYTKYKQSFSTIITQHVLEHIPKTEVIDVVRKLREMLRNDGKLIIAVPNAQAYTGCYWAYEDFTHHTLYTSGSIFYVLKAADFNTIEFKDIDCTTGLNLFKRYIKKYFFYLYDVKYRIMCKMLGNATHISSPNIYSYEIKVVAKK